MVVFVDEDNGDVDNIPSDGEGLDGDDETSDESEADSSSDVSRRTCTPTESITNLGTRTTIFIFTVLAPYLPWFVEETGLSVYAI